MAQRGVSKRARAEAFQHVEGKTKQHNIKLEEEVRKLQEGLDRCIKERISLKGRIVALERALKEKKSAEEDTD